MQTKKFKNIFKYLPMDFGRVVCFGMPLYFRIKKIYLSGASKGFLKGGAIIASNHTGFIDPLIIGNCFWYRRVFFLAAKEVMKNPILAILLKGIGCIKIDREISDIEAIRKCVSLVKSGKCLSVFPQGGIHQDGEIDRIKSGAVLIAMQANVPIIPIYSVERKAWWHRQKVVIGEPFNCRDYCSKKFPSVTDIAQVSEKLLEKMEDCKAAYEHQD